MLDHYRPIAVFVRAIELGSFKDAARALGVSPSVVSHHISQLEERLGVTLIYRTTRQLALTQDGTTLLEAGRQMLAAAQSGLDAICGRSDTPIGRLRITAPASFSGLQIAGDIAAFCIAFPKIRLEVTYSDQRLNLDTGGFDVALQIALDRPTELPVGHRRLYGVHRQIVATPEYCARHPTPVTPQDLAEWDWISLPWAPRQAVFTRQGCAPETVTTAPVMLVDSGLARHSAAKAGLGITSTISVLAHDDLRRGSIVRVLSDWDVTDACIIMSTPIGSTRTGLAGYFVRFLEARAVVRNGRLDHPDDPAICAAFADVSAKRACPSADTTELPRSIA